MREENKTFLNLAVKQPGSDEALQMCWELWNNKNLHTLREMKAFERIVATWAKSIAYNIKGEWKSIDLQETYLQSRTWLLERLSEYEHLHEESNVGGFVRMHAQYLRSRVRQEHTVGLDTRRHGNKQYQVNAIAKMLLGRTAQTQGSTPTLSMLRSELEKEIKNQIKEKLNTQESFTALNAKERREQVQTRYEKDGWAKGVRTFEGVLESGVNVSLDQIEQKEDIAGPGLVGVGSQSSEYEVQTQENLVRSIMNIEEDAVESDGLVSVEGGDLRQGQGRLRAPHAHWAWGVKEHFIGVERRIHFM